MSAHGNASPRPSVTVVMPFWGTGEDAAEAISRLATIQLGPSDETVLADNTPDQVAATIAAGSSVRVVDAGDEPGSYHARNLGAAASDGDFLLFLDADCIPPADLIDRYLPTPPAADVGILAGSVAGAAGQTSLVARWSRSRSALRSEVLSEEYDQPIGVTANLMVRREAWDRVGGFHEGVRSHGDGEFCWRVQEAGWRLDHVEPAAVEHLHRETLRALVRVSARYGAGAAWLNRRRPGSCPRPRPLRGLARCLVGAPWFGLTGRFERAAFKLVDAVAIAGTAAGYLASNRPPARSDLRRAESTPPPTAIVCSSFPVLAETFIASEARALSESGIPVRIEAVERPERPNWTAARGLAVTFIEDEGYLRRLGFMLWLAARHPLRCIGDLAGRGRWPREERIPLKSLAPMARRLQRWGARHLHAHFATTAAVTAARVARILGVTHSVTAHAYELFREPNGLAAKLDDAAFVSTGCEYNRRYLQAELPDGAPPIEKIVMAVDLERFRRSSPYPGGRRVLAVGRLVPKKGFADLLDALALLEARNPVERLVLVGDGPEREDLEERATRLRVRDRVDFRGPLEPDQVREELERADLLAMPSIVAPDGDRDSMPVVVKEALAMEVPVVATDEVGLPEIVRPEFGRLVPPQDPDALAAAIGKLLTLPAETRAQMGAAGRAWVEEHANVEREGQKVAGLISKAASG